MGPSVATGLDLVSKAWPARLRDSRIGLLVHPSSVNRGLIHATDLFISDRKFHLAALFGPQHGIRGETQDNMVEWRGFKDRRTAKPVYSLYGSTRIPTRKMLRDIDVMVIDIQDVGSRYYTFIWSMALVMKACEAANKSVVILDRPNPLGGRQLEGPVLSPGFESFVGLHPLPIRHGMTVGELAVYFRDAFYPGLDLHIVPMRGWHREMWFDDTSLPWVLPSPNMPTLDTAIVYPGICLLEGTNLSEGRGTTRPFEIFGAPFIEPDLLVSRLSEARLPGVKFRPLYFLPTFQKHAGRLCGGAQIHVTNRDKYKPFLTGVSIIKSVFDLYPKDFAWKLPPYEYEETLLPIDILAGTPSVREGIEQGESIRGMERSWSDSLSDFERKIRRRFLVYQ
jgi:uncharacterized protein YbbC (DUF1343 family)